MHNPCQAHGRPCIRTQQTEQSHRHHHADKPSHPRLLQGLAPLCTQLLAEYMLKPSQGVRSVYLLNACLCPSMCRSQRAPSASMMTLPTGVSVALQRGLWHLCFACTGLLGIGRLFMDPFVRWVKDEHGSMALLGLQFEWVSRSTLCWCCCEWVGPGAIDAPSKHATSDRLQQANPMHNCQVT